MSARADATTMGAWSVMRDAYCVLRIPSAPPLLRSRSPLPAPLASHVNSATRPPTGAGASPPPRGSARRTGHRGRRSCGRAPRRAARCAARPPTGGPVGPRGDDHQWLVELARQDGHEIRSRGVVDRQRRAGARPSCRLGSQFVECRQRPAQVEQTVEFHVVSRRRTKGPRRRTFVISPFVFRRFVFRPH